MAVNIHTKGKVDIADLVEPKVFQTTPGNIEVAFECLDKTKNVVFDEKALNTLNEKITEKVKGMDPRDPKVRMYIEEFCMKMLSELYRNGLAELEDAPDAKDDPYAEARKLYENL